MNAHTPIRYRYPFDYERERALEAFRNHKITIEHDEGVHRSLLFKAPNTSTYYFRLTTWPGHLAISGDIGTYVFSRLRDMFEFFASGDDWAAMPLRINASYWKEKCQSNDRHGGTDEFDEDGFHEYVVREFRQFDLSGYRKGTRMDVWRDVRSDLIENGFHDAREAITAAMGFQIPSYHLLDRVPNRVNKYPFSEAWDCSFTRPSFHYLLCCYAIIWGIKRYAQATQGRSQADHDRRVLVAA